MKCSQLRRNKKQNTGLFEKHISEKEDQTSELVRFSQHFCIFNYKYFDRYITDSHKIKFMVKCKHNIRKLRQPLEAGLSFTTRYGKTVNL